MEWLLFLLHVPKQVSSKPSGKPIVSVPTVPSTPGTIVPPGLPPGTTCRPMIMTKVVKGKVVTFVNKKGKLRCKTPGLPEFIYTPPPGPSTLLRPEVEDDPDDDIDDEILTRPPVPVVPVEPPSVPAFDQPMRMVYRTGVFNLLNFNQTIPFVSQRQIDPDFREDQALLHQIFWTTPGPFLDDTIANISLATFSMNSSKVGRDFEERGCFVCICSPNFDNEPLRMSWVNTLQQSGGGDTAFIIELENAEWYNDFDIPFGNQVTISKLNDGEQFYVKPTKEGINYFPFKYFLIETVDETTAAINRWNITFDAWFDPRCKFSNLGMKGAQFEPAANGEIFVPQTLVSVVPPGFQTVITEDNVNRFKSSHIRFSSMNTKLRFPPIVIIKSITICARLPITDPIVSNRLFYGISKASGAFAPYAMLPIDTEVTGDEVYFYRHTEQVEFEMSGIVVNVLNP